MRPLDEARRIVLDALPAMDVEVVPIERARNRVTAEAVTAAEAVPPFANSAVDGYAVRAGDVATVPVVLDVLEDVPAGSVPTVPVGAGAATRIMTGAPVPDGADAVVMVEDTAVDAEGRVEIRSSVEPGAAVRAAGSDLEVGDTVIERGVRLHARHLGSLASATGSVTVARRPTVAVMSTGEEIVEPDTTGLAPGTIRDTNRPILTALLDDLSVPVVDLGIVGDDLDSLRAAYLDAARRADLIVSTGGVSMGDYDFVKQVLGETGSVEFWQVAMQPAKPFAFGDVAGVPLFGLPGNPVSTFVAFEQFVRPGILSMMGANAVLRPRISGIMGEDVTTNPRKEVFVRVLIADDGGRMVAVRSGGQSSNVLSALASAEALAVVPVGVGAVSAGDPVQLEMITWPENREAP